MSDEPPEMIGTQNQSVVDYWKNKYEELLARFTVRKYVQSVSGDGPWTIQHNLNCVDVYVTAKDSHGGDMPIGLVHLDNDRCEVYVPGWVTRTVDRIVIQS